AMAIDPEVHGVATHECCAVHLLANIQLQQRINVGKENIFRIGVSRRNLRIERSEDAQLSIKRPGLIHVLTVLAGPEETLPFLVHNSARINLMIAKNLFFLFGEVLAHHSHHTHLSEKAGGKREVGRCSSKDSVYMTVRSLDGIEGDRANHQE